MNTRTNTTTRHLDKCNWNALGLSILNSLHIKPWQPHWLSQSFKLLHIRRTATDNTYSEESLHMDRSYKAQIQALVRHNPSSWSRYDYKIMTLKKYPIFLVAQRIFQSPKFEKLQILAFGDFSHGGRHKWSNLLLCRAVTPNPEVRFRVMSTKDVASYRRSGLLNVDFLTTCSRNHLLHDEVSLDRWGFP